MSSLTSGYSTAPSGEEVVQHRPRAEAVSAAHCGDVQYEYPRPAGGEYGAE